MKKREITESTMARKRTPLQESVSRRPVRPSKLRERQSVRGTFRLSKEAVKALTDLAKGSEIAIKEVVDFACRMLPRPSEDPSFAEFLESQKRQDTRDAARKTLVLTREALLILERFKDEHDVSRDVLLQAMILHLKNVTDTYKREMPERYQKVGEEVRALCTEASRVAKEIEAILDREDEYVIRFGQIVADLQRLNYDIKEEM